MFLFCFFFQRAEITRTYIKPPPNKTALDIPSDLEYNIYPSSTSPNSHHNRSTTTATKQSKQNPIAKFLLRISSSKSNEHNSNYSSLTSNSLSNVGTDNCNIKCNNTIINNTNQQQHRGNNNTSPSSFNSVAPCSSSHNLPTYSESQLMQQQQQQQQLIHSSSSWSATSSSINDNDNLKNSIAAASSIGLCNDSTNEMNCRRTPSPNANNIYKSRSMCGNIEACSLSSLSTLPTCAATIGSSSSTLSIASSSDALPLNPTTDTLIDAAGANVMTNANVDADDNCHTTQSSSGP